MAYTAEKPFDILGLGDWSQDGKLLPIVLLERDKESMGIVTAESGALRILREFDSDVKHIALSPKRDFIGSTCSTARSLESQINISMHSPETAGPSITPCLTIRKKMTWHLAGKTVGSTEEKVLYRHGSEVDRNSFPMGLSLSPDENYLAFTRGYTKEGKRIRGIVFLSVSDGTMRRVFADPEAISLFYAWSADSKSILFTRGAQNSQSKRQVWQVALDGSPPRRIGIEMEGLIGIAAHPDGKRIAYTASSRGTEL